MVRIFGTVKRQHGQQHKQAEHAEGVECRERVHHLALEGRGGGNVDWSRSRILHGEWPSVGVKDFNY